MKFKVGDRVNNTKYGDGTIIGIGESEPPYLVEFDKENNSLHDGNDFTVKYGKSKGKYYHCLWCYDSMITLIPKEEIRLQNGDMVTFKSENDKRILHMIIDNEDQFINKTIKEFDNLGRKSITLKVERPTYNTIYERKEEILDDVEKVYLKEYIDKYLKNCDNITIKKHESFNRYYIEFSFYNKTIKATDATSLPVFTNKNWYKNMEIGRPYTLKELNIKISNGKEE